MIFNKKYGDFGMIQMPTVLLSGAIAIMLMWSILYYALKPLVNYIYHLSFVNFDIITIIKNFAVNFHYLDMNFMTLLLILIMLGITLFIVKKSHKQTHEKNIMKYGVFSFLSYLFLYFFVLGTIWIGVVFDLIRGKRQRW
tara:strand:- start:36 stop:455 length:420 start_codon:yes stop_codon:yes gene_type:complete